MKDLYFTLNEMALYYSNLCNNTKDKYIISFDAFCFQAINQYKTEYDDMNYFLDDLENVCDEYLQSMILMFMRKYMFAEE